MLSRRSTFWRLAVVGALLVLVGLATAPTASAAAPDDRATLFFLRTVGTLSGKVEVHTATAASRYQAADLHTVTYFRTLEARQGYFRMIGRDLWFLKVCETGSGGWELHSATAATGYTAGAHLVADGQNSPVAHLPCDQQKALLAAGRVHVFSQSGHPNPAVSWADLRSGHPQSHVTYFGPTGAVYGTCNGDVPLESTGTYGTVYDAATVQQRGRAHPNFLRTPPTGSGPVSFVTFGDAALGSSYVCANVPSGSSTTSTDRPTVFTAGDASAGVLDVRDVTGDGVGDVTYVRTSHPGSGRIEVFFARGATPGTLALASSTWFSPALANAGTWQLGSTAS